jgi:hypothetical protein
VSATETGSGLILPGQSETLMLSTGTADVRLTLATMLVNTNDAFTGATGQTLGGLEPGDDFVIYGGTYDAGTEGNSETAASVPGPASGGTGVGYDAVRDDVDFVAIHGGVVTQSDGLASSTLDESHRFIGPTSMIRVERIE